MMASPLEPVIQGRAVPRNQKYPVLFITKRGRWPKLDVRIGQRARKKKLDFFPKSASKL